MNRREEDPLLEDLEIKQKSQICNRSFMLWDYYNRLANFHKLFYQLRTPFSKKEMTGKWKTGKGMTGQ